MGLRRSSVWLVLLVFVVACGSFVTDAYRTLHASATMYDVAMRSAADLYREGLLSEATKNEIVEVAGVYYTAYHSAVDALDTYAKAKTESNEQRVHLAMTEFSKAAADLLHYVRMMEEISGTDIYPSPN